MEAAKRDKRTMVEQSEIRGRFAIILIATGLLVWAYFANDGVRLGQDLKGGTTLRFSLDLDRARATGRIDPNRNPEEIVTETIAVIQDRIDKYGLAETQILPLGEDKFQITLPVGSAGQAEGIVNVVTQLGDLKFRIEVLPDDVYQRHAEREGKADKLKRLGVWPERTAESFNAFKTSEIALWKKARADGVPYEPSRPNRFELVKERGTDGSSDDHFKVLEVPSDPNEDFDGGILVDPVVGQSQAGMPVVNFNVRNEYQNVFGDWTSKNILLPMAIVLNDQYYSAPWINAKLDTNVQITLGTMSRIEAEKEAKELTTVLQTGALKVQPTLEAENRMGASLAGESRDRGILAIIVAFCLVLVFMIVYYRGSGVVANIALLLNLVMLVGFMAFFKAVLTLPGIAGIVLTVGMAVDANILINERIREEIRGGRTLRRAISEGYDRALSAIIDANVTSIITAIFLYNFGSGPVRGFAITLALGLMVSMFTAIYVTRTVFEWLLSNGKLTKLSMWGSGEPPKVDWIAMRRFFAPISVVGVVFGLLMFASTDKYTLYDVDFTGGYKVQMDFHQTTTVDDVKKALRETRTVDVKIREYDKKGDPTERTVSVDVGKYDSAQVLSIGGNDLSAEVKVQRLFEEGEGSKASEEARAEAFTSFLRDVLSDRLLPDWMMDGPTTYKHPESSTDEALKAVDDSIFARLAVLDPEGVVTAEALQALLETKFPYYILEDGRLVGKDPTAASITRSVVVRDAAEQPKGARAFDTWIKTTDASGKTIGLTLDEHRQRLAEYLGSEAFLAQMTEQVRPGTQDTPVNVTLSSPFSSTDVIGSSVAQRLKNDALVALVLSLIGIIIYIAIRFNSAAMGFAAVICLFHDVAITLGLVSVANTLGIVDAKINLAMVAAFLTLVGYSVNDTVVVFDRIRENRGKRPTIDSPLINLSINQTLARTIKTSVTFLLVCLALFAFNYGQRNVLEGFSFLLILGSIIGTYSTIAISSPLLRFLPWLWAKIKQMAPRSSIVTECAQSAVTIIFTPVVAVLYAAWWVVFGLVAFAIGLALFVPWAMSDEGETAAVAAKAA